MLTCDIDERWNGPPPRCDGKSKTYAIPMFIIGSGVEILSATCIGRVA